MCTCVIAAVGVAAAPLELGDVEGDRDAGGRARAVGGEAIVVQRQLELAGLAGQLGHPQQQRPLVAGIGQRQRVGGVGHRGRQIAVAHRGVGGGEARVEAHRVA